MVLLFLLYPSVQLLFSYFSILFPQGGSFSLSETGSSSQLWSSTSTRCFAVDLQPAVTPGDSALNGPVYLQV